MTEILIAVLLGILLYLMLRYFVEIKPPEDKYSKRIRIEEEKLNRVKDHLRQQERQEEEERSQENNRLRNLAVENEVIIIMAEDVNETGKPFAIARRADNTYVTITREGQRFHISEQLTYSTEVLDKWQWFSEDVYQRKLKAHNERNRLRDEQFRSQIQTLETYGIQYLYHMTHKSNLKNILENGLLSHNSARNGGLIQVDIADNQVNDRRLREEPVYHRSIHDYVPLYFNPKNPMLYRRRKIQNNIVILAIDKSVLLQPNTLFSDGNAASDSTSFFGELRDLSELNWDCLEAEYWSGFGDGKRMRCAEVLVYPSLPSTAIKKVLCNTSETKRFVENILVNHSSIHVEINPEFYFEAYNRQDDDSHNFQLPSDYYENRYQPPTDYTSFDYDDDLPF